MKLSYIDIFGDSQRHEIDATITTEHAASSYGQPVLLLDDGAPLNLESWVLMSYQVVRASPDELPLLQKWIANINGMIAREVLTPADMGRKGGAAKSAAKQAASRENGRRGGRPRKQK